MPGLRAVPAAALAIAMTACSLVPLDGLTGGVVLDAGSHDGSGLDAAGTDTGAPVPAYVAQVMADQPVAYWRFDELHGPTAKDSSGHGNDATYVGGVKLGALGAITGDPGTGVTLDGATGFVTAGNRFAFAGAQAPFSIEAWVMPASVGVYSGIASRNDAVGGPPSEGYILFVAPNDADLAIQRLDGASVSTATSSVPPSATAYTHVVATFDGLDMILYENGEPQGTQTAAFALAGAGSDFVVGAELGGGANYFPGTLDEVAVYDHALPADRVRAHYLVGQGSSP
ncbi:MAG TPA: LamG domain-containing protein [Polyangiaceae bacterium]|jgi:hypothetical protein